MKLDGDIELAPPYFRELMARFAADPHARVWPAACSTSRCPAAGCAASRSRASTSTARSSCYSSDCFAAIGGVQERLGWDTIDETYARMRGFETVSFSDLVSIHHRPIGSADGTVRGHARHGDCAYIAHHPLSWVMLRTLRVGGRAARRSSRASPSSTATAGPRPGGSSGSLTPSTAASRGVSCADGWSAP